MTSVPPLSFGVGHPIAWKGPFQAVFCRVLRTTRVASDGKGDASLAARRFAPKIPAKSTCWRRGGVVGPLRTGCGTGVLHWGA